MGPAGDDVMSNRRKEKAFPGEKGGRTMSAEAVALPISGALAAFFTYKVKFPSSLFSYHPTLLGVGWLALTPYAIKYLRDSKVQRWCMCARGRHAL
jgi:hypothetical protein